MSWVQGGLLVLAWSLASPSGAADASSEAGLCPDAEILSTLANNVCFNCFFPIRIAGIPLGAGPIPEGVTTQSVCTCDGESQGITLGSWHPTRLIELVPTPWCSPIMGGTRLSSSTSRLKGSVGHAEHDQGEVAFFNYHYFAIPWALLIDPFGATPCALAINNGLAYLSELDPTWNNDELAFLTHPEVALVANPMTLAACSADAVSATAGQPVDALFWCAGSWGWMYPFSGMMKASAGADPRLTSLAATRATAALHRRGLALKTVGDEALCGGVVAPFMQKSQYRMSMLYPVAEMQSNHAIGEHTFRWGLGHSYPGPGDSHVYLLWQWEDCCVPID